jgi:hypothetical protein
MPSSAQNSTMSRPRMGVKAITVVRAYAAWHEPA